MADTQAVADLRTMVRKHLDDIGLTFLRDQDDDFVVPVGPIMILLMPREWVDGQTIVVIGAALNDDVTVDPALIDYVNDRNAELLFGKLVVYREQRQVRFEHPLLGDFLNRAELEAAVKVVGATALRFRDEIRERWGGM